MRPIGCKGGVLIAGRRTDRQKQRKDQQKNLRMIALGALAAVLLIAAGIVLTRPKADEPLPAREPVEKLTDSIALPGYAELTLKAGVMEQEIAFRNPEQNFCYIQPSLWLADGTLLWRGQLIAPGGVGDAVILAHPLAAGEYKDAVLRYDCFRMDEEKTPLNGATTNLTLKVK